MANSHIWHFETCGATGLRTRDHCVQGSSVSQLYHDPKYCFKLLPKQKNFLTYDRKLVWWYWLLPSQAPGTNYVTLRRDLFWFFTCRYYPAGGMYTILILTFLRADIIQQVVCTRWAESQIRTDVSLRIMITSQAESTTVPFRQIHCNNRKE